MKKSTAWLSAILLILLIIVIGGGIAWFVYQQQPRQPAQQAARPASAVQGKPPEPGVQQPEPTKHLVLGGPRYFAGMPQPTREFPGHIQVLDNTGYSAGYCPERKTSAWVAYRVTKHPHVAAPKRPTQFLADSRVVGSPISRDYSNSGFDRGHLAPNRVIALCYGTEAQRETFLLTNIIPQRPDLNREVWEQLETVESETYGNRYGTIYVIDGPVYDRSSTETLAGGEAVPSACYKIIVRADQPDHPEILAFVMPQNVTGREQPSQFLTTVDEIERQTGLDFLRDLPDVEEDKIEAEQATGMW